LDVIANEDANIPRRGNLEEVHGIVAVGDHANDRPGYLGPNRRGRKLAPVGDHANEDANIPCRGNLQEEHGNAAVGDHLTATLDI
jgi:hypothetical protein